MGDNSAIAAAAEEEEVEVEAEEEVFREFVRRYKRSEWVPDERNFVGYEEKSEWIQMDEVVECYYNKTNSVGDPTSKEKLNKPPQGCETFSDNSSDLLCTQPRIVEEQYCGITLRQLRGVWANVKRRCEIEEWKDWEGNLRTPENVNLHDIEKYIVKPYTRTKRGSFVSTLPSTSTGGCQVPRFHVSVAFMMPMKDLLTCLDTFVHDFRINQSNGDDKQGGGMTINTPVWLLCFCTDRWAVTLYPENPFDTILEKVIRATEYRVLCLTCKDGIFMTRTWPIFECYLAMSYGYWCIYSPHGREVQDRAVGLVPGGAPGDAYTKDTLKRENKFPTSLIVKCIKFDVVKITATKEGDTKHVLNCIRCTNIVEDPLKSSRISSNELNRDPPESHEKYDDFNDRFRAYFTTPGTLQAALLLDNDSWQPMLDVMKKGKISRMRFDFKEGRGWEKLTDAQAVNLIKSLPHTIKSFKIRCANFNNEFICKFSDWIESSELTELHVEDTFVNSCINDNSVKHLAKALKNNGHIKNLKIWRTNQGTEHRVWEEDMKILTTLARKGEVTDAIFNDFEVLYRDDNPNLDNITFLQALFMRLDRPISDLKNETQHLALKWALELSTPRKAVLFQSEAGSFVKTILKSKVIKGDNLAVIMLDLYVQVAIVIILCLLNERGSVNDITRPILIICTLWANLREYLQLCTTEFKQYLVEPSNVIDNLQIYCVYVTVAISYLHDGEATRNQTINIPLITMCISWFALILKLSNVIFSLATFVTAFVQVIIALVPLLFTTILLTFMFAHAFRGSYINEECIDIHNEGNADNDDLNFEEGWKTCTVWQSYTNSLQMFLTNDKWNFVATPGATVTFFFALVVGVLLLNMVIAVVSNTFTEVQKDAKNVFWESRLSLIHEIESIWCLLDGFPSIKLYRSIENAERKERFPFSSKSSLKQMNLVDDKQLQEYAEWWFSPENYGGDTPSVCARLQVFYRYSVLEDIIFPGGIFTRMLLGMKYNTGLMQRAKGSAKIFVYIALFNIVVMPLFAFHVLIIIATFICGLFTFGRVWPTAMKKYLFYVCSAPELSESKGIIREIDALKEELRRENDKLKGEIKKLTEKIDE